MQITTIKVISKEISKEGIHFYAFFRTSFGLTLICKVNKGNLKLQRNTNAEKLFVYNNVNSILHSVLLKILRNYKESAQSFYFRVISTIT